MLKSSTFILIIIYFNITFFKFNSIVQFKFQNFLAYINHANLAFTKKRKLLKNNVNATILVGSCYKCIKICINILLQLICLKNQLILNFIYKIIFLFLKKLFLIPRKFDYYDFLLEFNQAKNQF